MECDQSYPSKQIYSLKCLIINEKMKIKHSVQVKKEKSKEIREQ